MKLRFRLILLSLSILMLISSVVLLYALLVDTKTKGPLVYNFGNVNLALTGDIKDNYIYPGENLVTETYVLTNTSTIDINLRIILEFYLDDMITPVDITAYTEIFDFNVPEIWTLNEDGYYYYTPNGGILSATGPITLFTNLTLNGTKVKNQFKDKNFKIKLTIQVKQNEFVTWSELIGQFID